MSEPAPRHSGPAACRKMRCDGGLSGRQALAQSVRQSHLAQFPGGEGHDGGDGLALAKGKPDLVLAQEQARGDPGGARVAVGVGVVARDAISISCGESEVGVITINTLVDRRSTRLK